MLINSISDLKALVPTIASNNFDRFIPTVFAAEQLLKSKIVGSKLFKTIEALDRLHPLRQMCSTYVALAAYLKAIPTLDVIETDNGFAVVNDSTLAPASTARVKALAEQISANMVEVVDNIQEYLEDNREYHEEWLSCEGCTLLVGTLIPTRSIYRHYGKFTGTRSEFVDIRTDLIVLADRYIAPVISADYLAELVARIDSAELTPADIRVVGYLRFALVAIRANDSLSFEFYCNRVKEVMLDDLDNYPTYADSSSFADSKTPTPSLDTEGILVI